jgi:hypothetical protein
MLFMAFCDIVVTLNLFILIFPLGMQIWINANDVIGRDITLYIEQHSQVHEEDDGPKKIGPEKKEIADAASKYGLKKEDVAAFGYHGPTEQSTRRTPEAAGVTATREIRSAELIDRFFKKLGTRPQSRKGLIPDKDDDDDEGLSTLFDELYGEKQFSYATIHLSSHLNLKGMRSVYGRLFNKVHVVQDAFPAVALMRLISVRTTDLQMGWDKDFVRVPSDIAKAFFVSCDDIDRFVDEIPDLSSCKKAGLFNSGVILSYAYKWSYLMSPDLSDVPVSLFVLTSLFLTIAFYVCFALTLFSNSVGKLLLHVTFVKQWVAVEKNPFVVSALLLIAILLPLVLPILLAFQVYSRAS